MFDSTALIPDVRHQDVREVVALAIVLPAFVYVLSLAKGKSVRRALASLTRAAALILSAKYVAVKHAQQVNPNCVTELQVVTPLKCLC